jgi:hypothetical protein
MPSEEVYGTEQLRQSPFVEKVMPDPSHPTSVAPWIGLVGKSTEDGYWRLYLTIELDSYIEFKEEDVLAFDIVPPKQSTLEVEAARVYLEPSARIKHVRMQSWEGEAGQGQAGATMASALSASQIVRGGSRGTGAPGGVIAQQAKGGQYCGSEVVTELEPTAGGGLQFCDYVRTCTTNDQGGRDYESTLIEGSCSGDILERGFLTQLIRALVSSRSFGT